MLISSRTVSGCPVCGQPGAACGGPTTHKPVDEANEEPTMAGPLKKYEVTQPNGTVAVLKLSEEHARRLGAKPAQKKAAPQPENKSRTAKNK